MFSFLKRHLNADPRDLEQVIYDIAEYNRATDFPAFYRLMATREVYVPIDEASLPTAAQPGVPYVVGPADNVVMRTISVPNNGTWATAATQQSHLVLASGYVGMPWLEFLRMAGKLAEVRGALLQGKTSWVALDKERIKSILA